MRYEVDAGDVRSAADDMGEALRQLSQVRVAERLGALVAAMPGGATARAIPGVQSGWHDELAGARASVHSLGDALSAAATAYVAAEGVARQTIGGLRDGRLGASGPGGGAR